MLFKSLISLCALLGAVTVSAKAIAKRATTGDFALYAYGTDAGIGGLPLYYSNGTAYIGTQTGNASATGMVTFSMNSTIVTVTANSSSIAAGQSLVFDPTANDDLKFAISPSSSQTDTGFTFFGSWLLWKSTSGALESSFYATPTGADNVWKVQWFANSTDAGTSVPISLKKNAPGNLAKTT